MDGKGYKIKKHNQKTTPKKLNHVKGCPMSKKTKILNILLALLITGAGIAVMFFLIKNRKEPPEKPAMTKGILVNCIKLKKKDIYAGINTTGTVAAHEKIAVIPQVGGMIISVAKNFEQGSIFKKNDLFFKIDPRDYELAARMSKANITKAATALLETKSLAAVAVKEWKIAKKFNKMKAASPLVLYEPQLKNAEAVLKSAKADYAKRVLDIKRTVIRAPFNCVVLSESTAPGRVVTPGSQLAVIAGTDCFDVVASIPYSETELINIPSISYTKASDMYKKLKGSEATISLDTEKGKYRWKSFVWRLLGDVDPAGRMPRIVLKIFDPYNLKHTHGQQVPPLVENSFVTIKIKGDMIKDVFPIPGKALRENNTVWIKLKDNTLDIRHVKLVRRENKTVFIRGHLKNDEKLVITSISGAAQGTKLRETGARQNLNFTPVMAWGSGEQ